MAKKGEKKQKKAAKSSVLSKEKSKKRLRKSTRKQAKTQAKKEVLKHAKLLGSYKLIKQSFSVIKNHWKPLLGITLVYSLLNLIFASSLINNLSSTLDNIQKNSLSGAASGFGDLVANAGLSSDSSVAQSLLFILETLVIVWALRHLLSGEKIGVKEAYYHSTFPLIPLILILVVIVLQLLPFSLSSAALALVLAGVFGTGTLLSVVFSVLFVLLTAWSLFMISSSIFAIYIVTLPNMQPLYALKSAKNLVRYRRWPTIRRLLFLPLFITFAMGVFIIPMIMFASILVTPTFFILSMLAILFSHTYLYNLYKGLLG